MQVDVESNTSSEAGRLSDFLLVSERFTRLVYPNAGSPYESFVRRGPNQGGESRQLRFQQYMEPASELRTLLKSLGQHDNRHRIAFEEKGGLMAGSIRSLHLLSSSQFL